MRGCRFLGLNILAFKTAYYRGTTYWGGSQNDRKVQTFGQHLSYNLSDVVRPPFVKRIDLKSREGARGVQEALGSSVKPKLHCFSSPCNLMTGDARPRFFESSKTLCSRSRCGAREALTVGYQPTSTTCNGSCAHTSQMT